MRTLLVLIALFCSYITKAQVAQPQEADTAHAPFKPDRPTEIGVSITTPILIAFGATDESGRYNNLVIRHRIDNRHSVRALIGAALPVGTYPDPAAAGIITGTQVTYYETVAKTRPSNFQVGIGYEFMFGGRLKQVPGIDIIYNNRFEKEEYATMEVKEVTEGNVTRTVYTKLDSTVVVKTFSTDNFGFNLNYSLRYPLSRRFVLTTSFIAALRYSQRRDQQGGTTTNIDFNVYGLIGDVSVFYRF